jgi:hypothetical protein
LSAFLPLLSLLVRRLGCSAGKPSGRIPANKGSFCGATQLPPARSRLQSSCHHSLGQWGCCPGRSVLQNRKKCHCAGLFGASGLWQTPSQNTHAAGTCAPHCVFKKSDASPPTVDRNTARIDPVSLAFVSLQDLNENTDKHNDRNQGLSTTGRHAHIRSQ